MVKISRELLKEYLTLIVIGIVTGIAVSIFYLALESLWSLTQFLISISKYFTIVVVIIGITLSYVIVEFFARVKRTGCGTHAVLEAYLTHNGFIHYRDTFSKTGASILTMGLGGSAGPEGPSMLLGGGLASIIARKFNISIPKLRRFFIAGSAAGVSAVFRAPLTGILFALEIPFRRDIEAEAFIEAVISSVTAYMIFVLINGPERLFPINIEFIELSPQEILYIILLSIFSSFVAIFFVESYIRLGKISKFLYLRLNPNIIPILGGFLIGLLALIDVRILGSGYDVIRSITSNSFHEPIYIIVILLVLKILATCITLNFGGSGGLFIPSLVVGALTSSIFIQSFHAEPALVYIAAGMAAVLSATSKTPLTAVALVAETCGPATIIPTIIAAVISYILTGNLSFFELQQPHKIIEEELALDEIYLRIIEMDPNIPRKIKVYQVMTRKPITVRDNESVADVLNKVRNYSFRVYPVVDEENKLIGYVNLEDILGLEELDIEVGKLIRKPVTVPPDENIRTVIRLMAEEETDHIFITDKDGKLLGIVAEMDIIRVLINELFKLTRGGMKR